MPIRVPHLLRIAVFAAAALLAAGATAQDAPQAVVITHGPVVESTTARSAVIAWSTNASAGTVVTYGIDPDHLTVRAEMPWGGYTHRVVLRDLQSDTTYYFKASSPNAEGSGATAESSVQQFTTGL